MSPLYWCWLVVVIEGFLQCGSVAVHHQVADNAERESDGSFRARDAAHYDDSRHNVDFDHEAILGSVREAEEFDRLSPEESQARLSQMLPRMDLNGDKNIDRSELKKWILKAFASLSKEEAQERIKEADSNKDNILTWSEYLQEAFGVDNEDELNPDETGDSGMFEDEVTSHFPADHKLLVHEERAMWKIADTNGDGVLDMSEFEVFTNPEEYPEMHEFLLNQTLREKDVDRDGKLSFQEFVGDRALHQDRDYVISEQDRFENDLDTNKDGVLDIDEIRAWIIPNNDEIAEEEVDHLFASSDDDHDDLLTFDEILSHHDVFVGSEATDFGNDLMGQHFDDEL